MKLLWTYLQHYKKLLVLALVLAAINQFFSLLDPQIFRVLIDKYATKAGQIPQAEFLQGVILLLGGTIGVALVSRIAKNFQDYYVNVIVQRLGARMYNHAVDHSFSLPYSVFEDQRSGEFLSKLQQARTDAQALIQLTINNLFLSFVGITFVLVYAFWVHWLIGLLYFLMIPTLGFATFYISKGIKKAQDEIVKQTQALAGSTTETLRNVELVKSLGLENQEVKHLNDTNETILQLELKKVRKVRKYSFIQGTLINAIRSGLMLAMLVLMSQQAITLGEFFSLLFYSFFIFNPLAELGNLSTKYFETKSSMARLDEILAMEREAKPTDPVYIKKVETIAFEDVSFKYQSNGENATEHLNLSFGSGQTVAFAGPSGAGKTTIIKLLVGLYKPTEGQLTFNGTDSNQIDWDSMRNKIGLVSQDTQLFAGTIRENLLFVRPDATDAEALEALRSAAALSIIERSSGADQKSLGLDTKIGEGGLKLSGGEKQRLAIARALLRQPDMIIFDEATSSLDSLTEEEITNTIQEIKSHHPNLITVLIAHRLSTITHADTIFVLEKGKVAESGSHSKLLDQKGLYAALWRQQIASRES